MPCAERAQKKAAKATLKKKPVEKGDDWVPIDGIWFAKATDGRGHYGGDGKYRVPVPVEDFGAHFHLGGSVRFTKVPGGKPSIFKLPDIVQACGISLIFDLQVHPEASGGRMIAVSGLEVKPAAA